MAIIDSRSKAKFDPVIRVNKADALMSFIMSSYNSRKETDVKESVIERLKSAYELYRVNGAGSYGDGKRDIKDQFKSHYTMGYEMGIWENEKCKLNSLAEKVATYEITVREYIGVVFLNLFSYYENEGENKYHHFLYEVLINIKNQNIDLTNIPKDVIKNTIPDIDKRGEQVNLIYNYLIATNFFEVTNKNAMKLVRNSEEYLDQLIENCNLEYKDKSEEDATNMTKDKLAYSKYVTKQPSKNNSVNRSNKLITKKNIKVNYQRIFFGAPGTGKSFKLNKETEEYFGSNYERVTFHPNYMYGNFVGAFKPFPYFLKDSDGSILTDEYGNKKESITYKYVEGPFMRILVKALKNPETNYLLLIEEINRANTAAVFGDFFQLLDRNIKGESEYPISTSEEVRMYLNMEFSDVDDEEIRTYIDSKIGNDYERLILPSNLYIWATMNSADQGVMPMDTAFKRRWNFEYVGIDEVLEDEEIAKKFEGYKFRITKDRIAKWNDFRVEVNKRLSECRVSEDKLIGPYFISKSVLESGDINEITNTIKNKVLMYLYEDAGKPYRNSIFLHEKSRTYSELCKNFDENGSGVFKISMDIGEEINTEEDKQTEDSLSEYKLKEDGMEGMVAEDNN